MMYLKNIKKQERHKFILCISMQATSNKNIKQ